MLSRSVGLPSRNNRPPDIWDTHGMSGDVFADPVASSSAPYPQESNLWVSNVSEHTSPHVMSESQTPAQDQRCQSGPPAKSSVLPSEGIERGNPLSTVTKDTNQVTNPRRLSSGDSKTRIPG